MANDVKVLTGGADGSPIKKSLLEKFKNLFTKTALFKKVGGRIIEVIPQGDILKTTGYFVTQETLKIIVSKMTAPSDGLWIDLGYGPTNDRGNEIQLVLTVGNEIHGDDFANTGKFCVATTKFINPTDPPFTGKPHPND